LVVMTVELADVLPPQGKNAILEALGQEAWWALQGRLSDVHLEEQQPLSAEEEGVDGLYFPVSCVMCRLVSLPEGSSVKVSIVGREGMTGTSALMDSSVSAFRTVVQLPGRALFLPRSRAAGLLDFPGVAPAFFRYLLLLVREASLTAACNRAHSAKERLARWLLLLGDRAGRDEFPLTHESLSAMLGVRRESVTLAANELRGAGSIEYRRATLAITDRSELKKQSCSCYPAVTESYARFLTAELSGSTPGRS
jgi:CRP-like cAMP-binding protein